MSKYVIIPAMGESKRFTDRGYRGHKMLFPVAPIFGQRFVTKFPNTDVSEPGEDHIVFKPMIKWIVDTIPEDWTPLVCVAPEFYGPTMRATEGRASILTMGPTRGQAETVLRALDALGSGGAFTGVDTPVAVHNSDMLTSLEDMRSFLAGMGNGVVVHRDDASWHGVTPFSYVDNPAWATRFVEKVRISPWAMSGVWSFGHPAALAVAIRSQIEEGVSLDGEFYLSGALNYLDDGMAGFNPSTRVDLGTPEAVAAAGWRIHQ